MNINVPSVARGHFWEEPPIGMWEFWSFRFKPKCEVGDTIVFNFDKLPVATAIVAHIEPPGQSECSRTGKFKNGWKVYWFPHTFKDLRKLNE